MRSHTGEMGRCPHRERRAPSVRDRSHALYLGQFTDTREDAWVRKHPSTEHHIADLPSTHVSPNEAGDHTREVVE